MALDQLGKGIVVAGPGHRRTNGHGAASELDGWVIVDSQKRPELVHEAAKINRRRPTISLCRCLRTTEHDVHKHLGPTRPTVNAGGRLGEPWTQEAYLTRGVRDPSSAPGDAAVSTMRVDTGTTAK